MRLNPTQRLDISSCWFASSAVFTSVTRGFSPAFAGLGLRHYLLPKAALGLRLFLKKPFDFDRLLELVRQHCR